MTITNFFLALFIVFFTIENGNLRTELEVCLDDTLESIVSEQLEGDSNANKTTTIID